MSYARELDGGCWTPTGSDAPRGLFRGRPFPTQPIQIGRVDIRIVQRLDGVKPLLIGAIP